MSIANILCGGHFSNFNGTAGYSAMGEELPNKENLNKIAINHWQNVEGSICRVRGKRWKVFEKKKILIKHFCSSNIKKC